MEITVKDCLQGAWQALLRNDIPERDRLLLLAKTAFKDNEPIDGDTPIRSVEGMSKQ